MAIAPKTYTLEDREAVLNQVKDERDALAQNIRADLIAIAAKIAAAREQKLYVEGLSQPLVTIEMAINSYLMQVPAPVPAPSI